MLIDVQLYEGRTLDVVTQVETLGTYGQLIAADYPSYTVACAMAETTERLTETEGEPSRQLFLLLAGALRTLSEGTHACELVLDAFLLRALAMAGWAPSFADCARCGAIGPHRAFAIAAGGAVCSSCRPPGAVAPHPLTLELLAALLTGDWAAADDSVPARRREGSGLVAAYAQWHLERQVRSLKWVDRGAGASPSVRRAVADAEAMAAARALGTSSSPQAPGGAPEPREAAESEGDVFHLPPEHVFPPQYGDEPVGS
jgi:DNA repair protein RecO (recombination protein O)